MVVKLIQHLFITASLKVITLLKNHEMYIILMRRCFDGDDFVYEA